VAIEEGAANKELAGKMRLHNRQDDQTAAL